MPVRGYPHAFAAALCTGLALANAARPPWLLLAGAMGAAALLALGAGGEWRLPALVAVLLLGGWWWGSLRLDALDRSVLLGHLGESARIIATVTAPARRSAFTLRVPAEVQRFDSLTLHEPVLLELPPARSPPQGAILELIGEVRLPRSAATGFDERGWLRRRGVQVVVRGTAPRIVGARGGLGGGADAIRARVARTLAPGVEGERRAVVAGVVLGDDEGLSSELRDSFRASGLYHLLAVSGQNVAYLAGGVVILAWLLGIPRPVGHLAVLPAIACYVLAVGWQPSVVRAGVAGALASLAWLAARQRDRWHVLLVGAFVLLAWNPYNLVDPGFQLSFVAVGAIFLLVPRVEAFLAGYPLPRPLAGAVAVSVACTVATAPLVWLHFGALPLFGLLANVLAAPAVAPLLGLALAAAGLEPVLPGAAAALGWLNGWVAVYLAGCARIVAALPHAQVSSLRGAGVLLAVCALLVAAGRSPPRTRRRLLGAALLTAVAFGVWSLWPAPSLPPPRGLRITFLDVGQGDGVLLQVPEGAVLVDQGPPEARMAEQLGRLGVHRLALLVLTHPQRDHIGGAADVLRKLDVDLALDPRLPAPSSDEAAALAAARRRRVPVRLARAGLRYRLGALRLRVLWPDGPGSPGQDPNDHAIVLLASYGRVDALLTADAESNVTLPRRPPQVEILKLAHHGSADPLLPGLLRLTRPRIAVISVGAGNDYGHPTSSTLRALEAVPGLDVYRTDRDGRVTFESDGRRIVVQEER